MECLVVSGVGDMDMELPIIAGIAEAADIRVAEATGMVVVEATGMVVVETTGTGVVGAGVTGVEGVVGAAGVEGLLSTMGTGELGILLPASEGCGVRGPMSVSSLMCPPRFVRLWSTLAIRFFFSSSPGMQLEI